MAAIRILEKVWETTRKHLFSLPGEHFAFYLADWSYSRGEPIFLVRDVVLIDDKKVIYGVMGMELSVSSILTAVNAAVQEHACLVEIHNHNGVRPRFSMTDRSNLAEFVDYVVSSLPGRPYAATVWSDTAIYGEHFVPEGRTGTINSVTVVGGQLRQAVSRDDEGFDNLDDRFARQLH